VRGCGTRISGCPRVAVPLTDSDCGSRGVGHPEGRGFCGPAARTRRLVVLGLRLGLRARPGRASAHPDAASSSRTTTRNGPTAHSTSNHRKVRSRRNARSHRRHQPLARSADTTASEADPRVPPRRRMTETPLLAPFTGAARSGGRRRGVVAASGYSPTTAKNTWPSYRSSQLPDQSRRPNVAVTRTVAPVTAVFRRTSSSPR
jgi:hypothetical protein